jgi:hypothetical protein
VTGSPEIVLLRGRVIVDGDEFLGRAGEGQFVKRARFGELLSPVGAAAAGWAQDSPAIRHVRKDCTAPASGSRAI